MNPPQELPQTFSPPSSLPFSVLGTFSGPPTDPNSAPSFSFDPSTIPAMPVQSLIDGGGMLADGETDSDFEIPAEAEIVEQEQEQEQEQETVVAATDEKGVEKPGEKEETEKSSEKKGDKPTPATKTTVVRKRTSANRPSGSKRRQAGNGQPVRGAGSRPKAFTGSRAKKEKEKEEEENKREVVPEDAEELFHLAIRTVFVNSTSVDAIEKALLCESSTRQAAGTVVGKITTTFLPYNDYDTSEALVLLEKLRDLVRRDIYLVKLNQASRICSGLLGARKESKRREMWIKQYRPERMAAFRDLLKYEKSFLFKLKMVVNRFVSPMEALTQEKKPFVTMDDVHAIFGNIREVLAAHEKFANRLRHFTDTNLPTVCGLGDLFLSMSQEFSPYGNYVRNCSAGIERCRRLQNVEPRFLQFVQKAERELPAALDGFQLLHLLPCPINQIGFYCNTLQRIFHATDLDAFPQKEIDSLQQALEAYDQLNTSVQFSFEFSNKLLRVAQIETLVSGLKEKSPGDALRRYVGSWNVTCCSKGVLASKKQPRTMFIFNDCVAFAKPLITLPPNSFGQEIPEFGPETSTEAPYELKEFVPMSEVSISADTGDKEASNGEAFMFTSPSFTCSCRFSDAKEAEEAKKYLGCDAKAKQTTKEGFFGVSITGLLALEGSAAKDGVPKPLEILCDRVRKEIDTEGLFRVAAGQGEMERIKEYFSSGGYRTAPAKLNDFTIFSITGTIKAYLREMPEPLCPYDMFNVLVEIGRDTTTDEAEKAKRIFDLIKKIRSEDKIFLRYLCNFLAEIDSASEQNKMTFSNLSIVITPNIIRPKVESIESTLSIPFITTAFTAFLRNKSLWENPTAWD